MIAPRTIAAEFTPLGHPMRALVRAVADNDHRTADGIRGGYEDREGQLSVAVNPVHRMQSLLTTVFGAKGSSIALSSERRASLQLTYDDEGNMVHPRCSWWVLPAMAAQAIEQAVAAGRDHAARGILTQHTPPHLKARGAAPVGPLGNPSWKK